MIMFHIRNNSAEACEAGIYRPVSKLAIFLHTKNMEEYIFYSKLVSYNSE